MSYTTIFNSSYGNSISVRRNDQYLTIRSESPVNSEPVYIYIPADEADDFLNRLDRVANAPSWTRAKFIRATPHNPRMDSYTLYRIDAEKWLHEDGMHITDSELARYHVDITVLA